MTVHPTYAVYGTMFAPEQVQLTPSEKKPKNAYEQRCIKFPKIGIFIGELQYLLAGLLEGDPSITYFVPRPGEVPVGKTVQVPDFYVRDSNGGAIYIIDGSLSSPHNAELERHFADQGLEVKVIRPERILDLKQEAENWFEIVRALIAAEDVRTSVEEEYLRNLIPIGGSFPFGEIFDPSDRNATYHLEIAIFRLLHKGVFSAKLNSHRLSKDTQFTRCELQLRQSFKNRINKIASLCITPDGTVEYK